MKKYKETHELVYKKESERSENVTETDRKFLKLESLGNRFLSFRKLATELQQATRTQVTAILIKEGLKG